jgi:SAM-dependent methyltransferase
MQSKGVLMDDESQRIIEAYYRLDARTQRAQRFYGYENVAHVVRVHERYRETLRLLNSTNYQSLTEVRFLDIGCGDGSLLRQFLQWGAQPKNLAGIELRPDAATLAQHLSPNLDIRCGSATELPWSNNDFNLIGLHTVFTSIFDLKMKQQIVGEISRVLRPGGAVLWYDFMYNNPRNRDVRGVRCREIAQLFPNFRLKLHRITLAPPIARRIPASWLAVLYPALAAFPFLRTHYLGLLIKPS